MKRKREQSGQVFQRHGSWYLRFYESRVIEGKVKRVRIARRIGEVITRGKHPPHIIEQEARRVLSTINNSQYTPENVLTLGDFVVRVYFPRIEQKLRPSTLRGYRDIWQDHLKARCASAWVKDVRTYHVQRWLDGIGSPGALGKRSLQHIKCLISGIFKLAKQQGYFVGGEPCSRYRDRCNGTRAAANVCLQPGRNPVHAENTSRAGRDDLRRGCVCWPPPRRTSRPAMGRLCRWRDSCNPVGLGRTCHGT